MTPAGTSCLVACLAWDDVERRLREGAAAILPIGAGAKQHGFHLPMRTDQTQAEWFALRLAEHAQALVWPTLPYGTYPAFAAYAGSISIASATFEALVRDIVTDLRRFRPRAVLILDTGLSTVAPVDRAIREFTGEPPVRHLALYKGRRFRETADRLRQQAHGSHADEIETSIMLAIAPELVDMARAEASPAVRHATIRGPLSPDNPTSPAYSRSGSFGDPTLATREKGERLVEAMLDDLREAAAQASS